MSEVAALAANLARNCGYAVFPVNDNKQPALKDWPHRASRDPDVVLRLWRTHPAPLVGIATGTASGISVLDIDAKHQVAHLWWRTHHARLLPTRVYATRSGGLHLCFRHHNGIRNSQGRICEGIDTRGEGGYVVSWWCVGFECKDHTPPAPWPDWLLRQLLHGPTPSRPLEQRRRSGADHGLIALIERVTNATEGARNGMLYWAACRCRDRGILSAPTQASLIAAARQAGLSEIEARRTIASAMGRSA
jgi:hypothetical protein